MKLNNLITALIAGGTTFNITAAATPITNTVVSDTLATDTVSISTPLLSRDSIFAFNDPRMTRKRPWKAALEAVGMNVGVWAFDRYVMNEDFAKINFKTIGDNITNGLVWDNDQFSTNLFAHPYHGSLYFNSARTNGLNFWESAPYAFGGSLMWEMVAEIEPPAINDLLATTFGGIALGEMTYRLSALVLDDSKRGFPRFAREFLGTLICPVRGLNRMISGDMWKVKHKYYKYHDYERIPVDFTISVGTRYLAADNYLFRGEYNPYIDFRFQYGDAFDTDSSQPYDYFTARASVGLSPNQPLISQINLLGKLWGTTTTTRSGMEVLFGIFQHFNYYDSEEVIDGSGRIPYKISETTSFGPGVIYKFPKVNKMVDLEQRLFLSGILLGGSLTDYYHVIDRNYNMGSGYSLKNNTIIDFNKYGLFALNVNLYHIFSWKGYSEEDLEDSNPLYLNAQGDKGNALLAVVNPIIEINLNEHFRVNLEASYYYRRTHYTRHIDVKSKTFETKLGIAYHF